MEPLVFDPNMHPSQLPAVAAKRHSLRQLQIHKPSEFTAAHARRLDELTDGLILAYALALNRLAAAMKNLPGM